MTFVNVRVVLQGPPERTRDFIMRAAVRRSRMGDW
jgi:hypothetical protein